MASERAHERREEEASDEFITDPTGFVLAIVDDASEAEALEQRLRDEHYQDVRLYLGGKGEHAIDPEGQEHGVLEQAVRNVQRGLTNKDNLAEYAGALHEGSAVIAFRPSDEERRDQALPLLEQHGAHTVNSFETAVVRTLKP